LSAFCFTGSPPPDLLYDNSDRALRAFGAAGIRTDPIVLPRRLGLAGVRSSGHVEVDGHRLWVRYSTYLRDSTDALQGLLVEEICAVTADAYFRLGTDIGALSSATQAAFIERVGLTAAHVQAAVAADGERLRAQAARGPVLSGEQRRFLSTALAMWDGVASSRPLPITALGYPDWPGFDADVARLRAQLHQAEPQFSQREWTRILLLAEISFASDLLGAGVEFDLVSGWTDAEAVAVLRSIQRALGPTVDASLLFPHAGRRPGR